MRRTTVSSKVDYNNNCNGCNDEYWFNLDDPVLDRHLRVVRYDGPRSPALASAAMAAGAALGTSGAAGLDPDFGDGGIASYDLSDPKEQILDTAQEADGSVLALVATDLALVETRALVRYEADGDVEEVFPHLSRSDLPGIAGALSGMNSIHVSDSGEIYVTGTRIVAGPPELRAYSLAMRILPSGALDESFGEDGIVETNPPNSGYAFAYRLRDHRRPPVSGRRRQHQRAGGAGYHPHLHRARDGRGLRRLRRRRDDSRLVPGWVRAWRRLAASTSTARDASSWPLGLRTARTSDLALMRFTDRRGAGSHVRRRRRPDQ